MCTKRMICCLTCGLYGVESSVDEETRLLEKDESGSAEEIIVHDSPADSSKTNKNTIISTQEEARGQYALGCTSQGCLPRGVIQGYQQKLIPLETYRVILEHEKCIPHLKKSSKYTHGEGDFLRTAAVKNDALPAKLDVNSNETKEASGISDKGDSSEVSQHDNSRYLRYCVEGHVVSSEENVLVNSPLWRQLQELNSPLDIRPPTPSMY